MTVEPFLWGWAQDEKEVQARVDLVSNLVGHHIESVEYWNLEVSDDYVVTSQFQGLPEFVEMGLQLKFGDKGSWFLTWDPHGDVEGLNFSPGNLLALLQRPLKVTPASNRAPWSFVTGEELIKIDLNYQRWHSSMPGYWCNLVRLAFDTGSISIDMSEPDRDGRAVPSANGLGIHWRSTTGAR